MSFHTVKHITDTLTIDRNADGSQDVVCWLCEESCPQDAPDVKTFEADHIDCAELPAFDCGYSINDMARDNLDPRAIYS